MNLILLWPEDWTEREEEGEEAVETGGAGVCHGGGRRGHAASGADLGQHDSPSESKAGAGGAGSLPTGQPSDGAGLVVATTRAVCGVAVLADDRRVGHVRNVIRSEVGDVLKVGEVDGLIGTATVTTLSHDRVVLAVRLTQPPPAPSSVTLVLALPEKTTFAHVLHQVTVLGVKTVYVVGAVNVNASWWGAHVLRKDSIREMLTLGLEQAIDTTMPTVHLRQVSACAHLARSLAHSLTHTLAKHAFAHARTCNHARLCALC